jgi:S-formylglutathione hydrolase FrmB
MLGDMSVIDPPFLLMLGGVALVVFVAGWRPARRRWLRFGVRGLGVVMIVLVTAAAINARYEYLPTWASLFGKRAADQISLAQLRQLEQGGALNGQLASSGRVTRGVVVPFTIPGTESQVHARTAQVYLPPAYFLKPHRSLPVVELLHGEPGSPADWTRGAYVDVTADDYAAQHHGFAPILVMPDTNGGWLRDSECVNGKRGQVQTYLTKDVRNAVIARFHARRDPQGWGIAGLSEGGYCALQIGLRNPDLYRTIGDYSGGSGPSVSGGLGKIFAGTPAQIASQAAAYNPVELLKHWNPAAASPAIWFEDGSQDSTLKVMALQDSMARHLGFVTHVMLFSGPNHSFGFWGKSFADSLPWMVQRMTHLAHPATFAPGGLRAAG